MAHRTAAISRDRLGNRVSLCHAPGHTPQRAACKCHICHKVFQSDVNLFNHIAGHHNSRDAGIQTMATGDNDVDRVPMNLILKQYLTFSTPTRYLNDNLGEEKCEHSSHQRNDGGLATVGRQLNSTTQIVSHEYKQKRMLYAQQKYNRHNIKKYPESSAEDHKQTQASRRTVKKFVDRECQSVATGEHVKALGDRFIEEDHQRIIEPSRKNGICGRQAVGKGFRKGSEARRMVSVTNHISRHMNNKCAVINNHQSTFLVDVATEVATASLQAKKARIASNDNEELERVKAKLKERREREQRTSGFKRRNIQSKDPQDLDLNLYMSQEKSTQAMDWSIGDNSGQETYKGTNRTGFVHLDYNNNQSLEPEITRVKELPLSSCIPDEISSLMAQANKTKLIDDEVDIIMKDKGIRNCIQELEGRKMKNCLTGNSIGEPQVKIAKVQFLSKWEVKEEKRHGKSLRREALKRRRQHARNDEQIYSAAGSSEDLTSIDDINKCVDINFCFAKQQKEIPVAIKRKAYPDTAAVSETRKSSEENITYGNVNVGETGDLGQGSWRSNDTNYLMSENKPEYCSDTAPSLYDLLVDSSSYDEEYDVSQIYGKRKRSPVLLNNFKLQSSIQNDSCIYETPAYTEEASAAESLRPYFHPEWPWTKPEAQLTHNAFTSRHIYQPAFSGIKASDSLDLNPVSHYAENNSVIDYHIKPEAQMAQSSAWHRYNNPLTEIDASDSLDSDPGPPCAESGASDCESDDSEVIPSVEEINRLLHNVFIGHMPATP